MLQSLGSSTLQGEPVTRFLNVLCAHCPSIAEMRFRTYTVTRSLDDRLKLSKTIDPEWLSTAERTARESRSSLWDALAKMAINDQHRLPIDVFAEALTHPHDDHERTFVLTRQEVSESSVDSICQRVDKQDGLALCSEIRVLDGYTAHIPMLDFVCGTTEANRANVSKMLRAMNQSGVIVNSGKSYHFLGLRLLGHDEWVRFMGSALLLAPFIDTRFIGHRLRDGECLLRVFAESKLPSIPIVVEFI